MEGDTVILRCSKEKFVHSIPTFLFCFFGLTFTLPFVVNGEEIWEAGDLVANLEVNIYRQLSFDAAGLTVKLKNLSAKPITLSKRPNPYAIAHIKMYRSDGTELTSDIKRIYEIRLPTREDYVEIQPGDEIIMYFSCTLNTEKKTDAMTETINSELFIDFESSVILVPEIGVYALTFHLEIKSQSAKFNQQEYQLDNVWYGEVVSNPVIIQIKRGKSGRFVFE